jgi:hypothetical protein
MEPGLEKHARYTNGRYYDDAINASLSPFCAFHTVNLGNEGSQYQDRDLLNAYFS